MYESLFQQAEWLLHGELTSIAQLLCLMMIKIESSFKWWLDMHTGKLVLIWFTFLQIGSYGLADQLAVTVRLLYVLNWWPLFCTLFMIVSVSVSTFNFRKQHIAAMLGIEIITS
jgi:hypothetical protein